MLIKHELKEPFIKNYSVMSLCFARNAFVHVTRVCDSTLNNARVPVYAELTCNDYFGDDEEVDAIDKTK